MNDSATERVSRALHGEPVVVAGMTYVPAMVLTGITWGAGHSGIPLVDAACSAMAPDFVFVTAEEPWSARAAHLLAEQGVAVMWSVTGPFGRAADRLGWSEVLRLSAHRQSVFADVLDEGLPAIRTEVRSGLDLGVTAVVIADDLAAASGPLLAPDIALTEIVPRCAVAVDPAAGRGVPTVFHSDGDVRPLLTALVGAGFSAVHPGGLDSDDLAAHLTAARNSGLVTLGGLPASALRSGPAPTEQAVTAALIASLQGGLLVADDGGISTTNELSAFVSALAAVRGARG